MKKEKMTQVTLFCDNDRYKGDVFVAVNGKTFLIRRGETVTVPGYVARVLANSDRMDALSARRRAEMAGEDD